MPRLRVDRDTPDDEIIESMRNLYTRSHDLDVELANPRLFDAKRRQDIKDARDGLHVEINRLITIMQARRRRVPSAPIAS